MRPKIFINLPIKDLKRSMDFYAALGFKNKPEFTDATAACMEYSEEIYVMILTHAKYSEFTNKTIIDGSTQSGVILSLSVNSNDELNSLMEKAVNAGAIEHKEAQDYGFMQLRSFEDPDGHTWEVFYMDPAQIPQQ